jgi:hypothetical protein
LHEHRHGLAEDTATISWERYWRRGPLRDDDGCEGMMTVVHDPAGGPDETLEGLLRAVEAEFGARLDETGREHVRRQLTRMLANSRALAAFPLTNDQEPDARFDARWEEGR